MGLVQCLFRICFLYNFQYFCSDRLLCLGLLLTLISLSIKKAHHPHYHLICFPISEVDYNSLQNHNHLDHLLSIQIYLFCLDLNPVWIYSHLIDFHSKKYSRYHFCFGFVIVLLIFLGFVLDSPVIVVLVGSLSGCFYGSVYGLFYKYSFTFLFLHQLLFIYTKCRNHIIFIFIFIFIRDSSDTP